jgi:hypothetical protein
MRLDSELKHVGCPYCGERIEIVIDLSVEQQEYVEDCFVCCRPIVMSVTTNEEGASVTVRSEND